MTGVQTCALPIFAGSADVFSSICVLDALQGQGGHTSMAANHHVPIQSLFFTADVPGGCSPGDGGDGVSGGFTGQSDLLL